MVLPAHGCYSPDIPRYGNNGSNNARRSKRSRDDAIIHNEPRKYGAVVWIQFPERGKITWWPAVEWNNRAGSARPILIYPPIYKSSLPLIVDEEHARTARPFTGTEANIKDFTNNAKGISKTLKLYIKEAKKIVKTERSISSSSSLLSLPSMLTSSSSSSNNSHLLSTRKLFTAGGNVRSSSSSSSSLSSKSITKSASQLAKQEKDEAWIILWNKLKQSGWMLLKVPKNEIFQNYYMPPGVYRNDPKFKNRRDYFDSKVQVQRFMNETTSHEKTSNYNRSKKRFKKNYDSKSSSSSSSSLTDDKNKEKEKLKNMLTRMNKIDNMAKQRGVQGTPDGLEQTMRDVFKTLYNVTLP